MIKVVETKPITLNRKVNVETSTGTLFAITSSQLPFARTELRKCTILKSSLTLNVQPTYTPKDHATVSFCTRETVCPRHLADQDGSRLTFGRKSAGHWCLMLVTSLYASADLRLRGFHSCFRDVDPVC